MYSKLMCALKTKVIGTTEMRIAFVLLTTVMFILRMPSDGGGLGG